MSDAISPVCGRDKKKSKRSEDKDNTKKQLRKVGEKQRRDKLKSYLSVLAQEIPWISEGNQRVDRSQILKLTVNYLKFHQGVKEKRIGSQKWKPNFLSSDTLRQCLNEATGGFVMVVAHTGNVVFVSESISSILGHSTVNVIGLPIANILHDEDCGTFSQQFQTGDKNVSMCEGMPSDRERVQIFRPCSSSFHIFAPPRNKVDSFKNNHRSFMVRMQILLENSNNLQHEAIHVLGKISTEDPKTGGKNVDSNDKQNTWLIAVGRPVRNRVIHELSVMALDKLEWCSQHSMDGTVLFTDQRISQCLGVFSGESAGNSCYRYIVPEDIQAVSVSHMKIMTDDEVPQTIFRLKIPNQVVKYIMSRSVVVRDSWKKEAKFISSINIIIEKTEGDQLLEEQKKKVDALIAVTNLLSLHEDSPKITAQGEDRLDNSCIDPELGNDCGTSESPNSSDKDFESNGSTTSLLSTDLSPTENRSSSGSMKFGTPLLKSLLVGDITTTPNTLLTYTAQDSSETSPISICSHSINSGNPQPFNTSPENRNVTDQAKNDSQLKGNSPPPCSGGSLHVTCDKRSLPFSNGADGHQSNIGEISHVYHGSPNINNVGSSGDILTSSCINKDLISMTDHSCGQDTPAMFNLQRVRNWTASLSEVEMDMARNTDLGDSPGDCYSLSNLTHLHSHSDTSSPTIGSHVTTPPNSDQSSLLFSQPGSVQSYISPGQSSPLSSINLTLQPVLPFHQTSLTLLSSADDKENLQHSNISKSPPYPIPSSFTCHSSLPVSQSIPAQSGFLYGQPNSLQLNMPYGATKLNLTHSHADSGESGQLYNQSCHGQVQPTLAFAKSGLEEEVFDYSEPCSDQSCLPLHWSCTTHSRTIPSQQSPKSPNLPSSRLLRQQSFSEQSNSVGSPHYNQLHFEQTNHNGMNVPTVRKSSSDNQSEKVVNQLYEQSMNQEHYAQGQSGSSRYRCEQKNTDYSQLCGTEQRSIPISVQGSTPWKHNPIQSTTGISSTQLNVIYNDNTPVIAEKDLNSSISHEQATNSVSATKSSEAFQWKKDAAHLELAGQLHAKHKQLSESLGSQESVLDQVQGNLSLLMDTQTNSGHNGTGILQNVFNLQTSVQEQRMQLCNIEEEFMAKLLDTT
ncbi:hypoxia-inducible factor 1-alpha-like isoform X2 [Mizuhopecten yessoensis]|uniref:Aryl hydrocarbon receptor nuclear translocator-like protein 1 n=1 Tax=Mizuhopecten yessoensis TaxID=6573 RepID=A0A210PPU0_MIZYE|nr:hypoxia-inducible factor 1-alpha-like isoform X2 [Mizuhopecten yessoensis]OWF38501.1 Aryl hydrocarbon receptor nuclear translocator-like protein 1 [Mizuhopecten yessoensis]